MTVSRRDIVPEVGPQIPRVGMLATVRNRPGILAAVTPADGESGRLHLVHVEYKDSGLPSEDRLIWEHETGGKLLEPTALPSFHSTRPMRAEDFDALVRSARWTSLSPYLRGEDGGGSTQPVASPFRGAVQIEDYQLVPLLKALEMPRISLLIADDVGLGKTIEAGLIIAELLARRRIQRVLILTPGSLRLQWREEMWDKFSLNFNVVDRDETDRLRRDLGIDANPWRSFNRLIASYHYLRQPDVLERFRAASSQPEGTHTLPWDLLIVDECHHLMPPPFGEESDLCRMLRQVAPLFEHRIFLTATPHNGHTRSFTGLLELLDPVRFSQTNDLKESERGRVEQVVIRRLKRDINARTNPPKFCTRLPPAGIPLELGPRELALSSSFSEFRKKVRSILVKGTRREHVAGAFAIEILGKRLLSCPTAFAESWSRIKLGLAASQAATDAEVAAARRSVLAEPANDNEAQAREANAAEVVGAWLHGMTDALKPEISAIDKALVAMGLIADEGKVTDLDPKEDARFEATCALLERLLRERNKWRDDERIVIFTEYKTTLDYLTRRLRERYGEDGRVLTLFGGPEAPREPVKDAFNDPAAEVRVLVATDAASEGLNLQRTARYMLHFDCPWNPSRLEQRCGRIDRHGQPRDVTIHHFVSEQDEDLKFLAHIIKKVDQIREDLGATADVLDEAIHKRMIEGESAAQVQKEFDSRLDFARSRSVYTPDSTASTVAEGQVEYQALKDMAKEIDLDPDAMRELLDTAMSEKSGSSQLEPVSAPGVYRIRNPDLDDWAEVIDENIRRSQGSHQGRGAVAKLAFSAEPFLEKVGPRLVFSPKPDVRMMHLAHPLMGRALTHLTRRRLPGTMALSRWTVRLGDIPKGLDALILFTIEELGVNELREPFHHWSRTVPLGIKNGKLVTDIATQPGFAWRGAKAASDDKFTEQARDLLEDATDSLKKWLKAQAETLTSSLQNQMRGELERAKKDEQARYKSRQGEISTLIQSNTLARLEREIERLKSERDQGLLPGFKRDEDIRELAIERRKEELARRRQQYEEVQGRLEKERERILKEMLPRRYALAGPARVFPVTVEVRLPKGRGK